MVNYPQLVWVLPLIMSPFFSTSTDLTDFPGGIIHIHIFQRAQFVYVIDCVDRNNLIVQLLSKLDEVVQITSQLKQLYVLILCPFWSSKTSMQLHLPRWIFFPYKAACLKLCCHEIQYTKAVFCISIETWWSPIVVFSLWKRGPSVSEANVVRIIRVS